MSTKVLFIVFIITLAGVLFLGIYAYSLSQRKTAEITTINSSQYYHLSYKNTPILNSYLNNWGIWKKNNVVLYGSPVKYTVKKIQLELTDEKYTTNAVPDPTNLSVIMQSSNLQVDSNNTLVIKIYQIPPPSSITEVMRDNANELFLAYVIKLLYEISHSSSKSRAEDINTVLRKLNATPETNPFTVTIKQGL